MSADSTAFYKLPPAVRQAAMDKACERHGAENFFDLDPAERAEAYRKALSPTT